MHTTKRINEFFTKKMFAIFSMLHIRSLLSAATLQNIFFQELFCELIGFEFFYSNCRRSYTQGLISEISFLQL